MDALNSARGVIVGLLIGAALWSLTAAYVLHDSRATCESHTSRDTCVAALR